MADSTPCLWLTIYVALSLYFERFSDMAGLAI